MRRLSVQACVRHDGDLRVRHRDLLVLVDIDLEVLADSHLSLEEFSYDRFSGGRCFVPEHEYHKYYSQTAAALVNVLRRYSCLHKVSLLGDSLHSVNLEELLPYSHLFYELEFRKEDRSITFGQGISNLLVNCTQLTKLRYQGSGSEEDSRFIIAIHQSCPLLEELQLSCVSFNQQMQAAGAGSFTNISRNCKQLRKLSVFRGELSVSILRSIAGIEALKELTLTTCDGLTDADMSVLATMTLEKLIIDSDKHFDWTAASLQPFVGSNISQTLETFHLSAYSNTTPIDDFQVATALASCHNLKELKVYGGTDACVLGRSGLDGLQAMVTGCPLLTDMFVSLTVSGIHCLGTHLTNLKKCRIFNRFTIKEFPSDKELQTLYPGVTFTH